MNDRQATVEVHDHHILVKIPQFTVFGDITAVRRLTAEQCFDLERQLAEARAKVLSERTEPKAEPINWAGYIAQWTDPTLGETEPKPETWRDRESLL